MEKLEIVLGREVELAKVLLQKLIDLSSSSKGISAVDLLHASKDGLHEVENRYERYEHRDDRRLLDDYYQLLEKLDRARYIDVSGTPLRVVWGPAILSMPEVAKEFFIKTY